MKTKLLVLLILLLSFFLRFYKIESIPPSLYWDEVAAGYNAKSIVETGKDEYGKPWPLFFQSFEDYKLPGYVYSTAIAVKFLGLNETSVRIPSAIFGIIAVLLVFFIGKTIAGNRFGLLSSFFMSVVPLHVHFSRQGFEANLGLTVFLAGLFFLLRSRRNYVFIVFSAFFLSLSMYFYNAYRIFIPIFVSLISLRYLREMGIKRIFVFVTVFSLFLIPLVLTLFDESGISRFKQVGIIGNQEILNRIPTSLIKHRYYVYFEEFTKGYFSHFTYNFLFGSGDGNPRHQAGDGGIIYKFELPLILLGFYFAYKKRYTYFLTLLIIFILTPIPAALTLPVPHTLRTLRFAPLSSLFASFGVYYLLKLKSPAFRSFLIAGVLIAVIFSMKDYLTYYYTYYPITSAKAWAYGYKDVFLKIKKVEDKYPNIFVTGYYWRPYIYYLFYENVPALEFQTNPIHSHIRNVYFGHADYDSTDRHYDYKVDSMNFRQMPGSLMVISPSELKSGDIIIDSVKEPAGQMLFYFIET